MSRVAHIEGVRVIAHAPRPDARGTFTKLLHPADLALAPDASFGLREAFVSWSNPGVIRGMHCQLPPSAHAKLVTCLAGRVRDVVLDLRAASPTFGHHLQIDLDGAAPSSVLVPVGCAHGFAVLGDIPALMAYATTREHDPARDTGVRWDSFGCEWPLAGTLLISDRDRALPAFGDPNAVFP